MVSVFVFAAALATSGANPNITIAPISGDRWRVSYRLARPAARLQLPVTPDDTRRKEWQPSRGFQIVHEDGADYLQRADGRRFRTTGAVMPVHFSMPPKAYTPFSPYSDGGVLAYTGQFFGCPNSCASGSHWRFTLNVPARQHAIFDGRVRRGRVSWTDTGDGRAVYVGSAPAVVTSNLLAVIDQGLPASIRDNLTLALPKFIDNYAKHLGTPPARPMLFASYVAKYGSGFGSKGGSLPGQVFVGLYGDPAGKGTQSVPMALTWHFAHEASHLFQQGAIPSDDAAWIHEGMAEALAYLSMEAVGGEAAAYADRQLTKSRQQCAKGLASTALDNATGAGRVDLHYPCGLLIQLAVDAAVKKTHPQTDGLYAVWRDYRGRVAAGDPAAESTYIAAIANQAGEPTAQWVRKVTASKLDDPGFVLSRPA